MTTKTTTGISFDIAIGEPTAYDVASFVAKNYLAVGEVTNIPAFGASAAVDITFPLDSDSAAKNKGQIDYGVTVLECALDDVDLGQGILRDHVDGTYKDLSLSVRLTYENGETRFFTAKASAFKEDNGAINKMANALITLDLTGKPLLFGAGDAAQASLKLSFCNNTYLLNNNPTSSDDLFAFTRASTATYWGKDVDQWGQEKILLKTAAVDEKRLQHDPVTGECLGYLAEGYNENEFIYSEDFTNAAWIKASVTVTADQSIAPDGTLAMNAINDNFAGSGVFRIYDSISTTINDDIYRSFFIKKGKADYILVNSDTGGLVYFDLIQGVVSNNVSAFSASITAIEDYFLIEVGHTAGSTDATDNQFIFATNNGSSGSTYTGTGSGVLFYLWGAMVSEKPSTYIKSEATSGIREPDVLQITDTSQWYNANGSSLVAIGTFIGGSAVDSDDRSIVSLDDGTVNNTVKLYNDSGFTGLEVEDGGVNQATVNDSAESELFSVALRIKSDNIGLSTNKTTSPVTDTLAAVPTIDTFNIGCDYNGVNQLNGVISEISVYPVAFSDTKLEAST